MNKKKLSKSQIKTCPGTKTFPSYSTGSNGLPLAKIVLPCKYKRHNMVGKSSKKNDVSQAKKIRSNKNLPCSMYKLLQPCTQIVKLGWREQEWAVSTYQEISQTLRDRIFSLGSKKYH